jgi:DNA adenine methylase
VEGVLFPVLAEAQARQNRPLTVPHRIRPAQRIGRPKAARRKPPPVAPLVSTGFPIAVPGGPRPPPPPAGSTRARPFLKWAGGKRQLLREILAELPTEMGTFHEPFVGGGAVFFAVRPPAAVLSDSNARLIRAYRGVRDAVEDVVAMLKACRNDKDFYLEMRRQDIDRRSDAEVAAWLIFLNKTGYNGLYRVNSRNLFNVPFGDNAGATLCDEDNLRACARALAAADLRCEDFTTVLDRARPGDVVYFDPPYVPLSVTSYFTSYTSGGFGPADQTRLRDVALELKKRQVFVLLSNSSAALVRELYEKAFTCIPVSAARMVNRDAAGRGRILELLIK